MKKTGSLLLMLVASTCMYAQDSTRLISMAKGDDQKALEVYKTQPDTAITYFKRAADLYKVAKNYRAAAISLQNAAYVNEDVRKDNYKAMDMGKEALIMWRKTTDKQNTADAYRFLAAQHGKMNDNMNARLKSDTAIIYYNDLKDNKGISIVYLNLAAMYEIQRNLDSAIKYNVMAREAREKVKNSDNALFNIDNTLLRVYAISDHPSETKKLLKSLSKQAKKSSVSKQDKMNFYYYAWVYYTKIGDTEEATANKTAYDELKK